MKAKMLMALLSVGAVAFGAAYVVIAGGNATGPGSDACIACCGDDCKSCCGDDCTCGTGEGGCKKELKATAESTAKAAKGCCASKSV